MTEINWTQDDWFAKHHAASLTDAFKEWWLKVYGSPYDYDLGEDEQHVYWTRCGFALMGWNAARTAIKEKLTRVVLRTLEIGGMPKQD